MASNKSRLNMGHGFMQAIIRNQVDRDNYDKEVKARQSQPQSGRSSGKRKPNVATYVPPSLRGEATSGDSSPNESQLEALLFKFEYEDEYGEVHTFNINRDSNLLGISQALGESLHMTTPMVLALANFLKLERKKALQSS